MTDFVTVKKSVVQTCYKYVLNNTYLDGNASMS